MNARSLLLLPAAALAVLPGCAAPVGPAATPSTEPAAATVSFDTLVVPFDVTPPEELAGVTPEQFFGHVLNWQSSVDSELRIRGVVPVMYFPAGTASPELPADYGDYIKSLHQLEISDEATISVDGEDAEVFTFSVAPDSFVGGDGLRRRSNERR
jgi:ribosomal protein L25 (general stress protein Ctc)